MWILQTGLNGPSLLLTQLLQSKLPDKIIRWTQINKKYPRLPPILLPPRVSIFRVHQRGCQQGRHLPLKQHLPTGQLQICYCYLQAVPSAWLGNTPRDLQEKPALPLQPKIILLACSPPISYSAYNLLSFSPSFFVDAPLHTS